MRPCPGDLHRSAHDLHGQHGPEHRRQYPVFHRYNDGDATGTPLLGEGGTVAPCGPGCFTVTTVRTSSIVGFTAAKSPSPSPSQSSSPSPSAASPSQSSSPSPSAASPSQSSSPSPSAASPSQSSSPSSSPSLSPSPKAPGVLLRLVRHGLALGQPPLQHSPRAGSGCHPMGCGACTPPRFMHRLRTTG